MIECCSENIWYIKKSRKKKGKKRLLLVTIFVLFFVFSIFYYKWLVATQISNICCDFANASCTEAVNYSVTKSLDKSTNYNDLIVVEKNNLGDIVLMSANSYNINKISNEVSLITEAVLKQKIINGVPIPFFAFTGIGLLSGYGRIIQYKTLSVSSVYCDFSSEFKSVGINQTLHSIYINVICQVSIDIPNNHKKIEHQTKILLCESVLVGKIPEIYLNGKFFGNT